MEDRPDAPPQPDYEQLHPLFPLAQCVLLPHATIPLHIFEPRYRAMLQHAMDHTRTIAMALFDGQDWKTNYAEKPPIRPIVCLGTITRAQQLPDGRSQILLTGLSRCRVIDEPWHDPYRMALLEPLEGEPWMEMDFAEDRPTLDALFADDALQSWAAMTPLLRVLDASVPTPVLADLAGLTLTQDTELRYRLLAEPDAHQRVHWLMSILKQTQDILSHADRLGPAVARHGECLN